MLVACSKAPGVLYTHYQTLHTLHHVLDLIGSRQLGNLMCVCVCVCVCVYMYVLVFVFLLVCVRVCV